jgi:elongation factor P
LEYKHQKIARGGGKVIVKVKDLTTGAQLRKTYQSGAKLQKVRLKTLQAQYLYRNGSSFVFMDRENFEQFELSGNVVGDSARFLKEGLLVKLRFFEGQVVDFELPIKVEYTVEEAPPDIRGDTSQGGVKEVVLENGLKVRAPMFIKKSDKIVIDTRTGKYIERV